MRRRKVIALLMKSLTLEFGLGQGPALVKKRYRLTRMQIPGQSLHFQRPCVFLLAYSCFPQPLAHHTLVQRGWQTCDADLHQACLFQEGPAKINGATSTSCQMCEKQMLIFSHERTNTGWFHLDEISGIGRFMHKESTLSWPGTEKGGMVSSCSVGPEFLFGVMRVLEISYKTLWE